MLKGKLYDFTKNLAQLYLPAAGSLYLGLAQIWGLPAADKVTGSDVVVCVFLGAILKLSQVSYDHSEDRFDGTAFVDRTDPVNNPAIMLKEAGNKKKGELRLKVQEVEPPLGNRNQDVAPN